MTLDYVCLGPSPSMEECAQVGSVGYTERAREECARFRKLIVKKMGVPPQGASVQTKSFNHDFGTYFEVVCLFDSFYPEAVEYAYRCEDEAPPYWE